MSTMQILLFKYIIEFKDRSSVVTMRVKIVHLTMTRYESFVVNVSTNGRKIKSILFWVDYTIFKVKTSLLNIFVDIDDVMY